jgi:YD repeat-containing protein
VVGGSATEGTDFHAHIGHYQAAIGTSSLTIEVAHPIDDAIHEQNETILIELVPVFGVSLGDASVVTITLQDNDAPPETSGPTGPAVLSPDAVTRDQEQVNGAFYSIALASGALTATHSLPAYNGHESLGLVYNSAIAAPNPIFLVRHTLSDTAVPDTVGAILTLDGVAGTEVYYDTSSLATEDTVQIALQGDAAGLATGRYAYQIDVTEYFASPITTTYNGYVDIINNANSPFGAGWSVQGMERLWLVSGGTILELADGVSLWFADGETIGTYVSPAGDFSTLTENTDGTFTRVAKDGTATQFDSAGRQTAIVDLNGNETTYEYDTAGKLVSITDPFGSATTLTYDGDLVEQITDPAGRSMGLGYENGVLVSITDPDPDGAGSLSAPVIALGYDTAGKLADWTDPNANTTTFSFNFAGSVTTVTRPDDTQEHLTAAQVVGLVAPGSGTAGDPALAVLAGQMFASYTDANENTWNTRLDDLGFGLATQKTDPLGDTTYIVRNTDGLPTDIIDPLQRATSYDYDSQGNVTEVTLPDGTQYLYAYNSFGQVTQVTEPDPDAEGPRVGSVTQYVFDSAGNLTKVILPDDDSDPENNPTYIYTLDSHGWLTSSTDPNGNTTSFGYDSEGRLVLITYPGDEEASMAYDVAGYLASATNERGFTTSYTYDDLGRLTQITYPDDDSDPNNNPQETLSYDAAGNLTSQTNPLGNTTSLAFNTMNRLVSVTTPDPDGSGPQAAAVTLYGYDSVGNLTSITDPLERVTASVFDSANRLIQTSRGANYITDYGYDAAGQLTSMASPAPDAENSTNRLIANYTYNSRGQNISISDNTGRLQTFARNPSGELTGFT